MDQLEVLRDIVENLASMGANISPYSGCTSTRRTEKKVMPLHRIVSAHEMHENGTKSYFKREVRHTPATVLFLKTCTAEESANTFQSDLRDTVLGMIGRTAYFASHNIKGATKATPRIKGARTAADVHG
jgi:hypothetical protein